MASIMYLTGQEFVERRRRSAKRGMTADEERKKESRSTNKQTYKERINGRMDGG